MAEAATTSGMPRQRPDLPLTSSLRDAVQAVARALSALPVPGMLIGGIAVIIVACRG